MTSLALIPQQPGHVVHVPDQPIGTFNTAESYRVALAQATKLSESTLVPEKYRGNVGSCFMALEIATRIGASPMMVMQNLYDIKGKPSWSSQFIIGVINGSGRFSTLRWKTVPIGTRDIACQTVEYVGGQKNTKTKTATFPAYSSFAYAKLLEDGGVIEGPPVTTDMAIAEGWFQKPDSKWQTMQEVMVMYRAAALFGRFYCPDKLLGMHTVEENEDVYATPAQWVSSQPAGESSVTTTVDSLRAEFEEILANPMWSAKQQDDLRKRYAVADDSGRQQLITNARAHVTPAATQEVQAPPQPVQSAEKPAEEEVQDDRWMEKG
jgi:hypothetical protein